MEKAFSTELPTVRRHRLLAAFIPIPIMVAAITPVALLAGTPPSCPASRVGGRLASIPPTECGKYPASLVIKTRTACTYPRGLKVFTLVLNHFDFKHNRGKTGDMHGLADGVENRRTNSVLWAEYGITDRLQTGLALPYTFRHYRNDSNGIDDTSSGIGDMWAYAKYRIHSETPKLPGVAVDLWVKSSTGNRRRGLGNGETDLKVTTEISLRRGLWSFHLNPEFTLTGGDRGTLGPAADNRTALNAGIICHRSTWILPMIEMNALWWGHLGREVDVGGGVLMFLRKNVSLKVGIAVPVTVDMPWAANWVAWAKLATWF